MAFHKNHTLKIYNQKKKIVEDLNLQEIYKIFKKNEKVFVKNIHSTFVEFEMKEKKTNEFVEILLSNNEKIICTLDHEHFTDKGFIPTYELSLDDKMNHKNSQSHIIKIELIKEKGLSYDIKMFDIEEPFFELSSGILVTADKMEYEY